MTTLLQIYYWLIYHGFGHQSFRLWIPAGNPADWN